MTQLTLHFSLSEFASRDTAGGPAILPTGETLKNLYDLAAQLEVLRAEVDDKPITVISGWRTPAHNKRVGGAPKSQHLLGRAADIQIAGLSPRQVAVTIEVLIATGQMKQGGLGIYETFVHYDTRGIAARWNG